MIANSNASYNGRVRPTGLLVRASWQVTCFVTSRPGAFRVL